MTGARTSGYEPGGLVSSLRTVGQYHKTARQRRCLSFMIVVVSLCMVTSLQAQQSGSLTPPEDETLSSIFTLCPPLTPTTGATEDLRLRCTEVVANTGAGTGEERNALLPMAPEEIATQGTDAVKTSTKNIGARLAALRAGATGVSLRRFALNLDGQALPGTLVASLLPIAATSGAVSASTTPPFFKRLGLFVNGDLSLGDKEATQNEAGFDFTSIGVTAGVDYRFTRNVVLGLAFSYVSTDADFDNTSFVGTRQGGGVDIDAYTVSAYGTYYISDFYVDGIISYGWNKYDVDRNVIYDILGLDSAQMGITSNPLNRTTVNQRFKGDTDGNQFSLSFGVGYDFNQGGLTFGPVARVNYIEVDIDGYREDTPDNTNDGFGLRLAFDSQKIVSLTSVLGGQASYAISTGVGVLLPTIRVEWTHEFEDDRRTITSRFIADPANTDILIPTESPDRDFVNLGAGLSAVFPGGLSVFVNYETVLALDDITWHNATLGVRKEL